jgi:hypothetical protein
MPGKNSGREKPTMQRHIVLALLVMAVALLANKARASVFFTTGAPDGRLGAATQPAGNDHTENEAGDDFILANSSLINSSGFTGLLPLGTPLSSIQQVVVEIYRVFPKDSVNPPDGMVPTRVNSPSDNAFDFRDSAALGLTFVPVLLNANFSVANSIVNGINKSPNQTTGGEGPFSGEEVGFAVNFTVPFSLPADHYFFVPQVLLSNGNFLWLSTARTGPIFTGDLQAWIRNTNLDPDWLRMGTDIVGGSPAPTFNMAFSIEGTDTPEPASLGLAGLGLVALIVAKRNFRRPR